VIWDQVFSRNIDFDWVPILKLSAHLVKCC
jgi:hypothetical protein